MAQCSAIKRDGSRCTLQAEDQLDVCWAHNPRNAEQRRRRASKGGRSKAQRVTKELHQLLKDLAQQVIDGELETSRGAVANQLIGTRIRLLEFERRVRELDEVTERIEMLEQAVSEARRGRRWGS